MGPNARPTFTVETKTSLSRFFEIKEGESGVRAIENPAEMSPGSEIERVVLDHVAAVEKMRHEDPTGVFANTGVMRLLTDRARAPFTIASEVVTVVLGPDRLSSLMGLFLEPTKSYAFEPTAVMDAGTRLFLEGQGEILPMLGSKDETGGKAGVGDVTQKVNVPRPQLEAARSALVPAFEPHVEAVGGRIFQALDELSFHPVWRAELGRAVVSTSGEMPVETAALAGRLSAALSSGRLNQLGSLISETTGQILTETSDAEAKRLEGVRDGFTAEANAILSDIASWKSLVAARDLALRQVFFPFQQAAVSHEASLRNDGFVPKASPLPFGVVGARPTRDPLPGMTVFVTGEPGFAASELVGMFGRSDLPREFSGWEGLSVTRTPDQPNRLIVSGEKDGYVFSFPVELVRLPNK